MRYAILGTAQASDDDGTPVAVGGTRLRALLTALALRPGRSVPTHLLVEEVWDGDRPADAPAALQALVGRLRRALGHGAVRSAEGGYQLVATSEDVDLYRFERLVRSGAAAQDPAEAAARYDEALALWRGPALADLPEAAARSARWEAVRLDARRGRLEAAPALGQAERALPELTALCGERPLDEPLHAQRIPAPRGTRPGGGGAGGRGGPDGIPARLARHGPLSGRTRLLQLLRLLRLLRLGRHQDTRPAAQTAASGAAGIGGKRHDGPRQCGADAPSLPRPPPQTPNPTPNRPRPRRKGRRP
ncbi:BTAD domain-containing putative transcriptional regulator [Streptomyces sp. NPDC059456]|uniref:AfsR/SARP family transcriptional regulator n=1 Tax=Streptomyces sp. NPDC059456 TaxID=3346838 RepID=UPI00367BE81A